MKIYRINKIGQNIDYSNLSLEEQILLVKLNGHAINYIQNPSLEVQLEVITGKWEIEIITKINNDIELGRSKESPVEIKNVTQQIQQIQQTQQKIYNDFMKDTEDPELRSLFSWYNYSKLVESQYSGEYWIDDGTSIFADGDIGDINHEGYVIQHAQYLLCDGEDWEGGKMEIAEEIWQIVEGNPVLLEEATSYGISERTCEEDAEQIIAEFGERSGVLNPEKWQLFVIANGNYVHQSMDLRDYAMKNWGWKAVRGKNVQTWFLTASDLSSISSGLNEIVGYEDGSEKLLFNLEIRSNNKYFSDIPLEIINSKNPAAIQTFRHLAFG